MKSRMMESSLYWAEIGQLLLGSQDAVVADVSTQRLSRRPWAVQITATIHRSEEHPRDNFLVHWFVSAYALILIYTAKFRVCVAIRDGLTSYPYYISDETELLTWQIFSSLLMTTTPSHGTLSPPLCIYIHLRPECNHIWNNTIITCLTGTISSFTMDGVFQRFMSYPQHKVTYNSYLISMDFPPKQGSSRAHSSKYKGEFRFCETM